MIRSRDIAILNETRQATAIAEMADEQKPLADGWLSYTKGVKWICHATGVGLTQAVSDDDLDVLESFYTSRHVPPSIELTAYASEDLLKRLGQRGFRLVHFEHVLSRSLSAEDDPMVSLPFGMPEGLVIERTDPQDADRLRLHAKVVSHGFEEPGVQKSEAELDMIERSIRHPRSTGFLAFVNGTPAAACGMEICTINNTKACALWGTSVEKPFRKRGIQQALIAHRLAWAIKHGCELAIMESRPGIPSERNAARLGFSLTYVRVAMTKPLDAA